MSTNNIEINESEDNNIMITKNQNINNTEGNTILDKEEHISESSKLKSKSDVSKEKGKNDFFHDKEITEDSIIYFSNKLKAINKSYKIFLYISIVNYIINIIIYFESENILHSFFNLITILIILISVIHQAISFRHNFESISKELYIFIRKVIYIYIGLYVIYIINIIYIISNEIIEMTKIKYIKVENSSNNIMMLIYCLINIIIPSIHLYKLICVKKGIKDLSSARGEIYEIAKIGDVEIIQSVMNEI